MRKAIVIALAIVLVAVAGSPRLAVAGPAGQNAPPEIDAIFIDSKPNDGTPNSDTYRQWDKIRVRVSFTETVTVTGAPQLALTIGSQTRQAAYDSSDTTPKTLYFEYTVQSADSDTDGISIAANALTPVGSITYGNPRTAVLLNHNALSTSTGHRVNGTIENRVPSFAAPQMAYEATAGTKLEIELPRALASDGTLTGDGALSYGVSYIWRPAGCISSSGPSGAGGASGAIGSSGVLRFPNGITYDAPGSTDQHGGVIKVGKGTAAMSAVCFLLVANDQDDDSLTDLDDQGKWYFSIAVLNDYDGDNDGLIDVDSLVKMNAIRWDLDGDGAVDTGTAVADTAKYRVAFPHAMAGMGCLRDHDDDTATPKVAGCIGYELTANLDFDKNSDGSIDADDYYYNGGKGWAPIGNATKPFTATFNGDNKTISNLYINSTDSTADIGLFGVIGKCDANGNNCTDRGDIKNLGLINASVTRNNNSAGNVGSLAGKIWNGEVISCYATGSVSHTVLSTTASPSSTGGLIGNMGNSGKITASYAKTSVAGGATGTARSRVGGLVGRSSGTITASYATGSVRHTGGRGATGSLVGYHNDGYGGTITASYAIGAVRKGSKGGGLAGSGNGSATVTHSYWDAGTTGGGTTSNTTGANGKTTRELQSPQELPVAQRYTGIYANWNVDLDGNGVNGDDPWDFGTNRQYPVLKYGGLDPAKQRQTSIQSDNWNAPVVGEAVVAKLTGGTGNWQWYRLDGDWTLIAGSATTGTASSTYVPATVDAGKHLRAEVTFTASGSSQTLTTVNTAKVVAATTASAGTAATAVAMVGKQLSYQHASVTAAGTANRTAWRWQRCDNAGMTTNCAYVAASTAATAEYTPVAGDVGKYLRAYAYYANSANGNAWTRTETPVLGPVVAAPAASP